MQESTKTTLAIVLAILIVIGGIILFSRQTENETIQFIYKTTPNPEQSQISPGESAIIVVDMAGAVNNPGVYRLPIGARVEDGILAAGNFAADSDLQNFTISRAAILDDQQRIYVPHKGEANTASALSSNPVNKTQTKINLNTASKGELESLAGIGDKTSDKIIARRETKGRFTRIEELVEEKIMYQSSFDKIKDQLAV